MARWPMATSVRWTEAREGASVRSDSRGLLSGSPADLRSPSRAHGDFLHRSRGRSVHKRSPRSNGVYTACVMVSGDRESAKDTSNPSVTVELDHPASQPGNHDMTRQKNKGGSIRRNRFAHNVILVIMSCVLIAAGSMHTLAAQPLKTVGGKTKVKYTWLLALLTYSFPVSLVIWIIINRGRPEMPSKIMWKRCAFLGLLDAIGISLGSYALSTLPAIVYTILGGSSLIFVVLISLVSTTKSFHIVQYAGVVLMTIAVTVVGLSGTSQSTSIGTNEQALGVVACLVSSVSISLLCVLTQKMFAVEQAKGDLQFAWQLNICQSMFATLYILPLACFSAEFSELPRAFEAIREAGNMPTFVTVCILIVMAAPAQRFCNVAVTSFSSATLARSLTGPRRVVIMVVSFKLFGEEITRWKVIAAALMLVSLGIYMYGGYIVQRSKSNSGGQPSPVKHKHVK
ncbi:Sugar phosphate transporter domain-containing protein [Plasmodiophora brassicae]|uniref:Sugar phosphate transporter domain-containing protein n=1 Tax=Plasmodiophora brassicae TaxID=37360 RepID=A0A0G4IUM9_PLABS|nr:hypothetical protein PBRA_007093 [Plasmodiophora brassicae]